MGGLRPSPQTPQGHSHSHRAGPEATTGEPWAAVTSQTLCQHLPLAPPGVSPTQGPSPQPPVPPATTGPGWFLKTLCPHCSTSSPPILSLIHPNCILFPEATEMTLAKVPNSFHFAKPHGPISALIFRDLSTIFSSTVSSFLSKECPSLGL